MRNVKDLLTSESLARLLEAQSHINEAAKLFSRVYKNEGCPADVEAVQEGFYDHLAGMEKCIERLVGAAVYHHIFAEE